MKALAHRRSGIHPREGVGADVIAGAVAVFRPPVVDVIAACLRVRLSKLSFVYVWVRVARAVAASRSHVAVGQKKLACLSFSRTARTSATTRAQGR